MIYHDFCCFAWTLYDLSGIDVVYKDLLGFVTICYDVLGFVKIYVDLHNLLGFVTI